MINKFLQETLLPRTVFVPYIIAKTILFITSMVFWISGTRRSNTATSVLCIEAGVKGWESIEYKEMYQSACEFLQPDNVHRLVIQPEHNYFDLVSCVLNTNRITHYLYDPRSGNESSLLKLWKSLRLATLLQKNNVVPIVLLTDLSVRNSRLQSAVVSAQRGLVVCFVSPRRAGSIFPHSRLLGPSLMPFSIQTKEMLDDLIDHRPINIPAKTIFAGSLYEPRATILEKIRCGLASRGLIFEVRGRRVGEARTTDHAYWTGLCYSDIVVTTADQGFHYISPSGRMIQRGADWIDIPQLTYRYLEVLVSGSLLVAQDVPSVRRYFSPGEHFISFDSPENAIDLISYYLENAAERAKIAQCGKERADALISSRCFWMLIDAALGEDSLL